MGGSTSKPYPKPTASLPLYAEKAKVEELLDLAAVAKLSKADLPSPSPINLWKSKSNVVAISDYIPPVKVAFSSSLTPASAPLSYDDQRFIQQIGVASNCNVYLQTRKPYMNKYGGSYSTTYRMCCRECSAIKDLPSSTSYTDHYRNHLPPVIESFCAEHKHQGVTSSSTQVSTTLSVDTPTGRRFRFDPE